MQYTSLGRAGLKVGRLCLGTWNFGSYTEEREAFRIMDAALDTGIQFIDTANHYPDFMNCGRYEENNRTLGIEEIFPGPGGVAPEAYAW